MPPFTTFLSRWANRSGSTRSAVRRAKQATTKLGVTRLEDRVVPAVLPTDGPGMVNKVLADDGAASDYFGFSTAVEGNTLVVGAYLDDDSGNDSGSAYVYGWDGDSWELEARLTASDAGAEDQFGYSVAIAGDTIVIGANEATENGVKTGSVYVYTRTGGAWTEQAKLTAGESGEHVRFGTDVAIEGDTIVAGAWVQNVTSPIAESVYVFGRTGESWTEQARLFASDAAVGDAFGFSVAVNGGTIVAGAPFSERPGGNSDGTTYVFTQVDGVWSEEARLFVAGGGWFGADVTVHGDTLISSAKFNDDVGVNAGAVYAFTRTGTTWEQDAVLIPTEVDGGDRFGESVGYDGSTLVVGSVGDSDDATFAGSAYIYTRADGAWSQPTKIVPADATAQSFFGSGVSVSGDVYAIGAFSDRENGFGAGAVYVYGEPPAVYGPIGSDIRIDPFPATPHQTSAVGGNAAGDAVVVWWANLGDENGTDVYAQRVGPDGTKVGDPIRVNTTTARSQQFGSDAEGAVAVDAAGNFVVVWVSQGPSSPFDGIGAQVLGQRFNARGEKVGGEFFIGGYSPESRVNARDPVVAMTAEGEFLVVWTGGDPTSGEQLPRAFVLGRWYGADGVPLGEPFRVSEEQISTDYSVDVNANGDAVIAWKRFNGVVTDSVIEARLFSSDGTARSGVIPVSDGPARGHRFPRVAIDPVGNVVVNWTAVDYAEGSFSSIIFEELLFRQFAADGTPLGDPTPVNTDTQYRRIQSDIGIAADGSFVIVYYAGDNSIAYTEVHLRRFAADGTPIGGEVPVNEFTPGTQYLPGVTVDAAGNALVSWQDNRFSGNVPFNAYARKVGTPGLGDVFGPVVSAVRSDGVPVRTGDILAGGVTTIDIGFSEAITGATSAVTLLRNGNDASSLIASRVLIVDAPLDGSRPTYTLRVTFTGPLPVGRYSLVVADTIVDLAGNPLDGDRDGFAGGTFTRTFVVPGTPEAGPITQANTVTAGSQSSPVVASNASSTTIVAWRGNGPGDSDGLFARLYTPDGTPVGDEFRVTASATGSPQDIRVAIGPDGVAVVIWVNGTSGPAGVFAQRISPAGVPLGDEIRVDLSGFGSRSAGDVAVAADGTIIAVWGQNRFNGQGSDIYARLYDPTGVAIGTPFVVNGFTSGEQSRPAVSVVPGGGFAVAWQGGGEGDTSGVFARLLDSTGTPVGGDVRVNEATVGTQSLATVAATASGDVLVAWQTANAGLFDIVARAIDSSGADVGSEIQVTRGASPGIKTSPNVAGNSAGEFVITWASSAVGVQARAFDPTTDGLGPVLSVANGTSSSNPAVAADDAGNVTFVWRANEVSDSNIAVRRYSAGPTPAVPFARDIPVTLAEDTSAVLSASAFTAAVSGTAAGLVEVRIVGVPLQGTLTLDGAPVAVGQTVPTADLDRLTYTPRANITGPDRFTWIPVTTEGELPAASGRLIITPVADGPTLLEYGGFEREEDTAFVLALYINDPDGDAITYTVETPPAHGTLSEFVETSFGPQITYTPDPNFVGIDEVRFRLDDGTGLVTIATIGPFTITNTPDAPVATPLSVFSADSVVTGTVMGTDPDLDPLTFAIVSGPAVGTLDLDPDTGLFTYTGVVGGPASVSFTFTASDGGLTSPPATVTITRAGADGLASTFNAGVADLGSAARTLVGAFDQSSGSAPGVQSLVGGSSGSGGSVPLLTPNLASELGTVMLVDGLLADLPTFDPTGSPADWLAAARAAGLEVLGFLSGDESTPAAADGKLAEFRLFRTFARTDAGVFPAGLFDSDSLDSLDALPSGLNLDVDLNGSIVLTVDLVFGVTTDGFYLADDSDIRLTIDGTGAVSGSGDVDPASMSPNSLTGMAEVDFALVARVNGDGQPVYADQFASKSWLVYSATGTASARLDADVAPVQLTFIADWVVATTTGGVEVTPTVDLFGRLDLPGLVTVAGDTRTPASLDLTAVYDGTGWDLSAEIEPGSEFEWFDFQVDELALFARYDLSGLAGFGTGQLTTSLGGTGDAVIALDITFGPDMVVGTGTTTITDLSVGTGPTLVEADTLVVTALFAADPSGTTPATARVSVTSPELRVLPRGDGDAATAATTARVVDGSLTAAGRLVLTSSAVTLDFGTILKGTAQSVSLVMFPGQAADAPVVTIDTVTLTLVGLDALPVRLNEITVDRGGRLEIATLLAVATGPIPLGPTGQPVARFDGLRLSGNDLIFTASTGTFSGGLAVTATKVTALPGLAPGTDLTANGVTGTYNLGTGAYSLDLAEGRAIILGGLDVRIMAGTLEWSEDAEPGDVLVSAGMATAVVPAMAFAGMTPILRLTEFGLAQDGKFFLTSAALEIPESYTGTIAATGVVPFKVDSIVGIPDDPFDLDTMTFVVTGRFATDQFLADVPFTTRLFVGGEEATPGTPFAFVVRTESLATGDLALVDLPIITLEVNNLVVPGTDTVLAGEIRFGGTDEEGKLKFLPDTTAQVIGELTVASGTLLDAGRAVVLAGTRSVVAGRTRFDLVGTVTIDPTLADSPVDGTAAARFNVVVEADRAGADFRSLSITAQLDEAVISGLTIDLSPTLKLTVGTITYVSDPRVGEPFAFADDVRVTFPADPRLGPVTVNRVAIYDRAVDGNSIAGLVDAGDAFEIDYASLAIAGGFGPADGADLLSLDGGRLELIGLTNKNGPLEGTVRVTANTATLWPGEDALLSATIDSPVAGDPGLSGTYDLTSRVWTLTAARVTVNVDTALSLVSTGVKFTLDPSNPVTAIAFFEEFTASSPDFPSLGTVTGSDVSIFRDGFTSQGVVLTAGAGEPARYGDVLEVHGAILAATGLSYRRATGWTGVLRFSGLSATLLPDEPTVTVAIVPAVVGTPAVSGVYDLAGGLGTLSVTAGRVTLGLADVIEFEAENVRLDLDADTFATLTEATVRFPGVADFGSVVLSGVAVSRTGVSVGSTTVALASVADIAGVLRVTNGTLTVDGFTFDYADPLNAEVAAVTLSAAEADVFPSADGSGVGSVSDLVVELTSGAVTATASSATVRFDTALTATSTDLTFALNRDQAPGDTILTLGGVVVSSPDFSDFVPEATAKNLTISRTGFRLENLVVGGASGFTSSIDELISVTGLKLTATNLAFTRGTGFSGTVNVRSDEASLFPGVDGVTTVATPALPGGPAISGNYQIDPDGWSLFVVAGVLTFDVSGVLKATARGVSLALSDDTPDAVIARIPTATLELPGVGSFGTATLTEFQLSRNGATIASTTVTAPGPFVVEGVLELTGATLTVTDFEAAWGTGATVSTGEVTATFNRARLFPDSDGGQLGDIAGFKATLSESTTTFSADLVTLQFGDGLTLSGPVMIDLSAAVDEPILSIPTGTVSAPKLGTFFEDVSVTDVRVTRDGFTIASVARAIGASDTVRVGGLAELAGPEFTATGLGYTPADGFTGDVKFSATEGTLFPDSTVTLSVTDDDPTDDVRAITGAVSVSGGTVALAGRSIGFTAAGLLDVSAKGTPGGPPAFALTFDPDAKANAPLVTLAGLTAELGFLEAEGLTPVVTLDPVLVTHGGTFGFAGPDDGRDVAVVVPAGYTRALGVADVLPFAIKDLALSFANRTDLRNTAGVTVSVTGRFDLQPFIDDLGFTPTIRIGDVDLTAGDPFTLSLDTTSFGSGGLLPVGLGAITLGLDGLTIPGTDTVVNGQLQIGAIDKDGVIGVVEGSTSQVIGDLTVVSSGTLDAGLKAALAGTITTKSDGGAVLSATGTAALSVGGDGNPVQGSAAAGFAVTLDATRTDVAPFVTLDVSAELTDVTVTDVVFAFPGFKLEVDRVEYSTAGPGPDASLMGARLSFPEYPDWGTFTIDSLDGYDDNNDKTIDGFVLDGVSVPLPAGVTIGGTKVLSLTGFTLTADDVSFRPLNPDTTDRDLTGTFGLKAASGTLFPDGGLAGFSAGVTKLSGAINVDTGVASLTAGTVRFTLDDQIELAGTNVVFSLDAKSVEPLASLSQVTVSIPGIGDLGAKASNIQVYRDRVSVGQVGISVPGPVVAPGRLLSISDVNATVAGVTFDFVGNARSGAVTVNVGSAVLLPGVDGSSVASLDGLTAVLDEGVLAWQVDTASVDVDGLFTVTADDATFRYDTRPGAAERLFLSVPTATAELGVLPGVAFSVTGFTFSLDGDNTPAYTVDTFVADATIGDGFADTLGLGGLLPFDVSKVTVDFADPVDGSTDLRQFTLGVDGAFDFSRLDDLPFDVTFDIGGQSQTADNSGTFSFTAGVDLAAGTIVPLDFGPITLGISDFEVGPVVLGGSITLGGFAAGQLVPTVSGTLSIEGGIDAVTGDATVAVNGRYDAATSRLFLDAGFDLGFTLQDVFTVEGAGLDFSLVLAADPSSGFAVSVESVELTGAQVDLVRLKLGDVVSVEGTNVQLDLTAGADEPLVIFQGAAPADGGPPADGSATIVFDALLGGWGGTLYNFAVGSDLSLYLLDGFGASITIPQGEGFGLPDWVPLTVREIGLKFNQSPTSIVGGILAGSTQVSDLADVTLIFSGGLQGNEFFPITAQGERMEIDFGRLLAYKQAIADNVDLPAFSFDTFPIKNLDGFVVGVEPFDIGPVTIGGALGFGVLTVDKDPGPAVVEEQVLFGRVLGTFGYDGIGIDVELIVTEYGPVLSRIGAGVPIPIGTLRDGSKRGGES